MKQLFAAVLLVVFALVPTAFGQTKRTKVPDKAILMEKRKVKKDFSISTTIATPEAFTDGTATLIRWHTNVEVGNIGFYVYRTDGAVTQGVGNFVPGSELHYGKQAVYGETYSLLDEDGKPNSLYYVEAFLSDGRKISSTQVFPQFAASLSSLAGPGTTNNVIPPNSLLVSGVPSLSKTLKSTIDDNTLSPNMTIQRAIAAQTAVKIGVKQTGIYRVTSTQLQAAGFDINSDPTFWQLYVNGNEQAITIGPNASYVEFYGKGVDTLESDTQTYFLIKGLTAGKRITSFALRPSYRSVSAVSYVQDASLRERQNYLSGILNGSVSNFFGDPVSAGLPSPASVNFSLSSIDKTASTARIIVRVQGFTLGFSHVINISLNGQSVGQISGSSQQSMVLDTTVPTSILIEGQNVLQLTCSSSGDFSFFDSVDVIYSRGYSSSQNQLAFTASADLDTTVQGFASPNIRVFDVTDDKAPVQLTGLIISPDGTTYDANLPAYKESLLFAVEDSSILSPTFVKPNQPSTLSTTSHNANLVIISYKDFLTQANAWADYRRNQGYSVEVVDVEDVYDEFNYGVLSAQSLKDFLLFAKNNWQTPPQYVLLIGDATYDPRKLEAATPNPQNQNLIPAMLVDTQNEETASDDALVDYNNDGLAELAIGRIPADSTDIVSNALSKTMSFEQLAQSQTFSRGAVLAYDQPIGYDFGAVSTGLASELPSGTTTTLIQRPATTDPTPLANLVTAINNGPYLVNWAGHGSAGIWGASSFFQLGTVPQLTNQNRLSIFTMLTCLNGLFQSTINQSLGEALLNSTTGGSAASWASSGTTTPDVQQIMADRFYQQISTSNMTRLGDLILDAKSVVPGGRDVRLSWVLLGDPLLKVK